MPEITRSTGINPGFPHMGPLPGGGYRGLTEELDAAVTQAAELLRAEYGRDVEIRYNSDRQSGGAFVVDDLPPGWDHKCVVGICAALYSTTRRPEGMTAGEELRAHPDNGEYHRWLDSLPKDLVISTNVRAFALRDPSIATGSRGTYAYIDHPTLDAALAWLRENVREGAFNA
jgi:hypothetical protein